MASKDQRINLRLDEHIYNDFASIASSHGVTPSALATYVIGQYVVKTRRDNEAFQKSMDASMKETARQIQHLMTPDSFKELTQAIEDGTILNTK